MAGGVNCIVKNKNPWRNNSIYYLEKARTTFNRRFKKT